MKKLDCPQCGAAITDEKCPYCGAVFYDFSAITLNEPCYIKIKARSGDKEFLLRAKVMPREMNVTVRPCYIEAAEWDGAIVRPRRITHNEGEIEMRFQIVENIGEKLYEVEALEDVEKEASNGY